MKICWKTENSISIKDYEIFIYVFCQVQKSVVIVLVWSFPCIYLNIRLEIGVVSYFLFK